ncbi:MAG: GatB/YqeY domain-containing protein [Frankia sp.]
MGTLKQTLRTDLTASMKARDEVRTASLRMALAAVGEAEVAGKAARELSDDEVRAVLTREVRKRREAATAFADAGRAQQAARETVEGEILDAYLPAQLSDEQLSTIVDRVLAEQNLSGPRAIGPAMKAVRDAVAGQADGGRVASLVKARLAS